MTEQSLDDIPLHTVKELREFAMNVAQALAFLEDNLRRNDFVGEYIRWLGDKCSKDFMSFDGRVS